MRVAVRRQSLERCDQVQHLARLVDQANPAPAHPDDKVDLALAVLAEALPSMSIGIAAIADPHLARHWLAPIQCLPAMAVGEFQMLEPATRQIIDAVNAPVRSLAGRFAEAAAVADAQ